MEYDNEAVSEVVCRLDRDADKWVYNRYCRYCGKFIHPEDGAECPKCKTPTSNPVKRALPFLSSATAIEKLIIWVRRDGASPQLVNRISEIFDQWIKSARSPETYRLEIVIACVNALLSPAK